MQWRSFEISTYPPDIKAHKSQSLSAFFLHKYKDLKPNIYMYNTWTVLALAFNTLKSLNQSWNAFFDSLLFVSLSLLCVNRSSLCRNLCSNYFTAIPQLSEQSWQIAGATTVNVACKATNAPPPPRPLAPNFLKTEQLQICCSQREVKQKRSGN